MLLLERFREWRRTRDIRKRKRCLHTMAPHSIERAVIGLTLMLEGDIKTRGKVELSRPHLKNINDALAFHLNEMDKLITLKERPRELPDELKENRNETEIVWLDKFFLYHYKCSEKGIEETITILNGMLTKRNDISVGMRERFDHRIRKILKQLDVVVEHYTQLL